MLKRNTLEGVISVNPTEYYSSFMDFLKTTMTDPDVTLEKGSTNIIIKFPKTKHASCIWNIMQFSTSFSYIKHKIQIQDYPKSLCHKNIIKITRNNRTQWLQLKGNHDGGGAHSIYAFFVALQHAFQVPTWSLTKSNKLFDTSYLLINPSFHPILK